MLGLCYVAVQIVEMFTGIWIVHSLYAESKEKSMWVRGFWAIIFIILIVSYAENALGSFISNVFVLLHSILFAIWYCVNFKAKFLKVFLIEMLYMVNMSFLKLPVCIDFRGNYVRGFLNYGE